jgi:hypothetical protein
MGGCGSIVPSESGFGRHNGNSCDGECILELLKKGGTGAHENNVGGRSHGF